VRWTDGVDLLPKGVVLESDTSIKEAGLASRTVLVLTWRGGSSALKEEAVREAVGIEGVAMELVGDAPGPPNEPRTVSNKPKPDPKEDGYTVGGKFPKWMRKLSKK
jgi:hypothetical protein